ncbi:MAG: PD-(D/E)XK nuclease family protein [Candidatus Azobacteroides sp.]|nr:PD-(D/E)XK nuclease family protein [Candidatus Azobacteroides sp.]
MDKQTSPFLSLVAKDLIDRFGNDLSRVAVVFPGRRASLFFNNYLCEYTDDPIWAPQYLAIDDLFQQAGDLQIADSILLICELYRIYIEVYNRQTHTPSAETLDEFYFFGEILLNDFDDIDKNLVNARSLFGNLQDLDQLRDDFSHLNESQNEMLRRYLKFQGETALKTAFWSVWNILGEVYESFKTKLQQTGIAYPGMLMRSVIEKEKIDLSYEHYVFVGFNVLNKCEGKLFRKLKDKALFYWDFDNYYLDPKQDTFNEAGRFIRENIEKFGSALPVENFDNFLSRKPRIKIIASASENGQSAYIAPWLNELNLPVEFEAPDSAIVLCNEQILPTVMHSISPNKVENVNITMGFPITQTPICSFLQVLADMQVKGAIETSKAFRYKYVLPVLRHPYTQAIFPEAKEVEKTLLQGNIFFPTIDVLQDKTIFTYTHTTLDLAKYLLQLTELIGRSYEKETEVEDIYSGLYRESVFRTYQVINRLTGLIISGELQIDKTTLLRLMRKLFSSTNVPFHGEPVKGLQVMGMLETRALDFKHILLFSVNEGFMPGTNSDNTFIPQFLRKHFEMSTIEHQDSIYAYYFYRLIQRAEDVTFVYNTAQTQTGKAEISRFLLQLLIDSQIDIKRYSLQSAIKPLQPQPVEAPKTAALLEKIRHQFDQKTNPQAQRLSPSALNIFIDCSLRFYLQYIEGLQSKEELNDELDVSVFGTIFHRAAESLYREIGNLGEAKETAFGISQFPPFLIRKEHFDVYLENPHLIDKLVSKAFSEEYFKNKEVSLKNYNGEQLINFRVIRHILKRLIEFDRKQTPFYIHGLERKLYADFELPETDTVLKIGGIIDRLEEKDGVLKIIDYKTGGSAKPYKELNDLFTQKDNRASHVFQTFTYSSVLIKNGMEKPVVPSLLYMQDAGKDDYSPVIQYEKEDIADFHRIYPLFEELLIQKLTELFDKNIPFRQTTAVAKCNYCDFKVLCNR